MRRKNYYALMIVIYDDHHMNIILWQKVAKMISFQTMHDLLGLNLNLNLDIL